MATIFEKRLAMFVDRETEMQLFCDMLQPENRPIMVVWGESGIGKSSLMARMIHECALRKLLKSEIVVSEFSNRHYLAIMRKIRDDVSVALFEPFTDLVNYYTKENYELKITIDGNINVGEGMRVDGTTGDVAGVILKDFMIPNPRADMAVPETERIARLTDRFIKCLANASENEAILVFIDGMEKLPQDTEKWLCGELLIAVCDGRLPNVRLILCGQNKPDLGECELFSEEAQLSPLSREHVIEYLAKRGVKESSEELANLLMVVTKGKLSDIVIYVEGYLRMQSKTDNNL